MNVSYRRYLYHNNERLFAIKGQTFLSIGLSIFIKKKTAPWDQAELDVIMNYPLISCVQCLRNVPKPAT
jgi:hypothetical protein